MPRTAAAVVRAFFVLAAFGDDGDDDHDESENGIVGGVLFY